MAEEASNAVFALTEENKRLRSMVDFSIWKPIEMAPQDGTPILVGHEHAVFSAWWELAGSRTDTNHPAWVDGVTNSFDDYIAYEPTHWMPLPAPPVSPLLLITGGRNEQGRHNRIHLRPMRKGLSSKSVASSSRTYPCRYLDTILVDLRQYGARA